MILGVGAQDLTKACCPEYSEGYNFSYILRLSTSE